MSYFNELPDVDRRTIIAVIEDALAAGYAIDVHDSEEIAVSRATDLATVQGALCTTDEDRLIMFKDGVRCGFVWLVYGNEPGVVVCDYSVSLEPIMKRADFIAVGAQS